MGCRLTFRIQWITSAGSASGIADSRSIRVTDIPKRYSLTATAPTNTSAARVLVRITSINARDSFSLNLDGAMLEKSASVGSYFDGSMSGFQWLGKADASVSEAIISYPNAAYWRSD